MENLIDKLIYVKPGTYRAEPKVHRTGRRTHRKLDIDESCIAKVLRFEGTSDEKMYLVQLVYGEGYLYNKTVDNSEKRKHCKFYVKVNEAHHDGVVNRVYKKIERSGWNKIKRKDDFIIQREGKFEIEEPSGVCIDEMMKQGGKAMIYFFNEVMVEEKDLQKLRTPEEVVVIGRALAKELGTTARIEDLDMDDEQLAFNLLEFDFYRNISGKLLINNDSLPDLKKDLQEVFKKYTKPTYKHIYGEDTLHVDDNSEDDNIQNVTMSFNDVQVTALNMGMDIDKVLKEGRGILSSKKFGL